MGDKSPKSKQREKNQKDKAQVAAKVKKNAAAADASVLGIKKK